MPGRRRIFLTRAKMNRERMKMLRANQSEETRERVREQNRIRKTLRLQNETVEERELRNAKQRIYQRHRRSYQRSLRYNKITDVTLDEQHLHTDRERIMDLSEPIDEEESVVLPKEEVIDTLDPLLCVKEEPAADLEEEQVFPDGVPLEVTHIDGSHQEMTTCARPNVQELYLLHNIKMEFHAEDESTLQVEETSEFRKASPDEAYGTHQEVSNDVTGMNQGNQENNEVENTEACSKLFLALTGAVQFSSCSSTKTCDKDVSGTSNTNSEMCGNTLQETRRKVPEKNSAKKQTISYCCKKCRKSYKTIAAFKHHLFVYEKPYTCGTCKKSFERLSQIKPHILQKHHTLCTVCYKSFDKLHDTKMHIQMHSGYFRYRCNVCNIFYENLSQLNKHRHVHAVTHTSQCDKCFKSFKTLPSFRFHMLVHSIKFVRCSKYLELLMNHTLNHRAIIHTPDKQCKCNECIRFFESLQRVEEHRRSHCAIRFYKCNKCALTFESEYSLVKHQQSSHLEKCPPDCIKSEKYYKTFTNSKSLRKLKSLSELDRQEVSIRKINARRKVQQEIKCDKCEKIFMSPIRAREHQFVHTDERPDQCVVCCKKFKSPIALISHQRKIHTAEISLQCNICLKILTYSSFLRHCQIAHVSTRPYCCKECNKCFTTIYNLKGHQGTHNECNIMCDKCGKTFKTELRLKLHQVVHSDSWPFYCDKCQKCFKTSTALKNHETTLTHTKKKS